MCIVAVTSDGKKGQYYSVLLVNKVYVEMT